MTGTEMLRNTFPVLASRTSNTAGSDPSVTASCAPIASWMVPPRIPAPEYVHFTRAGLVARDGLSGEAGTCVRSANSCAPATDFS